ncbi:F-box protein At5g49610-like isoform X1 [Musa acuminata AAA Group]|uniref:F-box protein At5g49610-like isoform X1 n=1 Tax=Musa acuminata AAA Group TaxID=214697 RepID=UPI0031D90561
MDDELLVEILTRLPLKSLFRFTCVCKAWCRLISNDDYLRRKLPLITSAIFYTLEPDLMEEPRYACTSSDGGLGGCSLTFFPFHQSSTIVDVCNGLLLCFSSLLSAFHVLNPATRRWRKLPKPSKRSQRSIMAFDPCNSSEFKVVSFTGWVEQGAELEVFASDTGNWVEHHVHWGIHSDAMSTTMCFFDTTLYILAHPNYVVGIDVTSFDTCFKIELPEPIKHEARIGKSGGCLCYTHRDGDQLKIWKLRDSNGGTWVVRGVISIPWMVERSHRRSTSFPCLPLQCKFMAFHPQREVVYLWLRGEMVGYDVNEGSVEEAYELGKEMERAHFFQIWLFPFSCYMSNCLADAQGSSHCV